MLLWRLLKYKQKLSKTKKIKKSIKLVVKHSVKYINYIGYTQIMC